MGEVGLGTLRVVERTVTDGAARRSIITLLNFKNRLRKGIGPFPKDVYSCRPIA